MAITDGLVSAVGDGPASAGATDVLDAADCLVTPGLINTHHHLFQNLTRAYPPMTDKPLFGWLQSLYPLWRALDRRRRYLSAWVGLAELALSGCTTSTDHLYLHPHGAGDLLGAEIAAARELGMRFHPTRGSMSLSREGRRVAARRRGGRTTTTSSPPARRPSPATTTAATARWCASRWRRARRSASPNR